MAESPVAARSGERHTESCKPVMGFECIFVLDVYLVTTEPSSSTLTEFDGAKV